MTLLFQCRSIRNGCVPYLFFPSPKLSVNCSHIPLEMTFLKHDTKLKPLFSNDFYWVVKIVVVHCFGITQKFNHTNNNWSSQSCQRTSNQSLQKVKQKIEYISCEEDDDYAFLYSFCRENWRPMHISQLMDWNVVTQYPQKWRMQKVDSSLVRLLITMFPQIWIYKYSVNMVHIGYLRISYYTYIYIYIYVLRNNFMYLCTQGYLEQKE